MKISGVAIGQWNQICKNKEGVRRTIYKIHRAIVMGKVSHYYMNGDYIVRYHDMNILVSKVGLVMTIWRDTSVPTHHIPEEIKLKYDAETTHKQNIYKANQKHRISVRKGQMRNGENSKANVQVQAVTN